MPYCCNVGRPGVKKKIRTLHEPTWMLSDWTRTQQSTRFPINTFRERFTILTYILRESWNLFTVTGSSPTRLGLDQLGMRTRFSISLGIRRHALWIYGVKFVTDDGVVLTGIVQNCVCLATYAFPGFMNVQKLQWSRSRRSWCLCRVFWVVVNGIRIWTLKT